MIQLEFQAFECELTVYRRGCLQVRVNLDQGTMIWKDSRQWCNNFVRTLSDEQIDEFSELASLVRQSAIGQPEVQSGADQQPNNFEALILTIFLTDGRLVLGPSQIDPEAWNKLRRMIEKLSRVPFRL